MLIRLKMKHKTRLLPYMHQKRNYIYKYKNPPNPMKLNPLPFWSLEEKERQELVEEMHHVLVQKLPGRYAAELLRLTLERRASFIPSDMLRTEMASKIRSIQTKIEHDKTKKQTND